MDSGLTAVMSQMSLINLIERGGGGGGRHFHTPICFVHFTYLFENSSNRLHEDRELVSPRQLG